MRGSYVQNYILRVILLGFFTNLHCKIPIKKRSKYTVNLQQISRFLKNKSKKLLSIERSEAEGRAQRRCDSTNSTHSMRVVVPVPPCHRSGTLLFLGVLSLVSAFRGSKNVQKGVQNEVRVNFSGRLNFSGDFRAKFLQKMLLRRVVARWFRMHIRTYLQSIILTGFFFQNHAPRRSQSIGLWMTSYRFPAKHELMT